GKTGFVVFSSIFVKRIQTSLIRHTTNTGQRIYIDFRVGFVEKNIAEAGNQINVKLMGFHSVVVENLVNSWRMNASMRVRSGLITCTHPTGSQSCIAILAIVCRRLPLKAFSNTIVILQTGRKYVT